jgi:hypothetical protein
VCHRGPPRAAANLRGPIERAPERVRRDVVDERPPTVDLDDGEPFPVPRLELVVAGDVQLRQLELELLTQLGEDGACARAEMAPLRGVEDDASGRYG